MIAIDEKYNSSQIRGALEGDDTDRRCEDEDDMEGDDVVDRRCKDVGLTGLPPRRFSGGKQGKKGSWQGLELQLISFSFGF